jgi:hypothetical protein
MAERRKYPKEIVIKALKMYTEGKELNEIKEMAGLSGPGWKSLIYMWRKNAGIKRRLNMHNKRWADIKLEVEKENI